MSVRNGTTVGRSSAPVDVSGRLLLALVAYSPAADADLARVATELDDLLDSQPEPLEKLLPASRLLLRGVEALRSGDSADPPELLSTLVALAKVVYRAVLDLPHADLEQATKRLAACLETAAPPAQTASPRPARDTGPAFILLPDEPDVELLTEFIAEIHELIGMAGDALRALERNADDDEAIDRIFRSFHMIKGTAAFLGLEPMSVLAHRAETLLGRVRDKEISYGRSEAGLALRSIDVLKDLNAGLENALAGEDPSQPPDYLPLLAELVVAASADSGRGARPALAPK